VTITANTVFARNRVFSDLFASTSKGIQRGGAIFNRGGELLVRDSFFADNAATGDGGAIFNSQSGSTVLRSLAFNRNESGSVGGAIANEGTLRLLLTRVANNRATADGGVSESEAADTFIADTTFVGNTP